jgi:hypothetical protein
MTTMTPQDRTAVRPAPGEIPAQRATPPEPAGSSPGRAERASAPERAATSAPSVRPAANRAAPVRVAPVRRRWPAAVGGLAAGLTLGTVGTVGVAFALSAIALPVTALTLPALTSPASAVSPAGVSPNVSVPGRVRTTVGDGTWQVGVDIAAGTYQTIGSVEGATCRHALRTARTGGTVTAAGVSPSRDTVVLAETDGWFASAGCATWRRVG